MSNHLRRQARKTNLCGVHRKWVLEHLAGTSTSDEKMPNTHWRSESPLVRAEGFDVREPSSDDRSRQKAVEHFDRYFTLDAVPTEEVSHLPFLLFPTFAEDLYRVHFF